MTERKPLILIWDFGCTSLSTKEKNLSGALGIFEIQNLNGFFFSVLIALFSDAFFIRNLSSSCLTI